MSFKILIIGPAAVIENTSVTNFLAETVFSVEIQRGSAVKTLEQLSPNRCNLIVTLKDWETDEEATKLAQIARIAQIPVIHEINFATHVQTKNH